MNGRPQRRIRRLFGASALAAGLAGVGALGSASPAAAAVTQIGSNSGGANVRSCPNTTCTSYGYLSNGTPVTMLCWVDSQWVDPPKSDYSSARWFLLSTPVGTGYTHSSLVENQASVGHC
jgi:uncharacterized protein YraI